MLSMLLLAAVAATAPASVSPAPAAAAAAAPAGASIVVLVRHAEKAEGNDPALTDAGRARAEALAAAVTGMKLDAIVVSDTKRTAETAAPAAKARSLTPMIAPTSGGGQAHVKAVVDVIRAAPAGGAVLVVGHSNTLPLIIAALGGPQFAALCDGEFSPMLVLELPAGSGSPRLLRASYGAPDPPGASACH